MVRLRSTSFRCAHHDAGPVSHPELERKAMLRWALDKLRLRSQKAFTALSMTRLSHPERSERHLRAKSKDERSERHLRAKSKDEHSPARCLSGTKSKDERSRKMGVAMKTLHPP
jgi:hypothetical protein